MPQDLGCTGTWPCSSLLDCKQYLRIACVYACYHLRQRANGHSSQSPKGCRTSDRRCGLGAAGGGRTNCSCSARASKEAQTGEGKDHSSARKASGGRYPTANYSRRNQERVERFPVKYLL